jgi:lysophospholipase L1-like esterase
MFFKRCLIFLVIISLVGCHNEPTIKPLHKTDLILAFGDSLTFGTGAEAQYSYPATLEKLIGMRVVNGGVPGDTVDKGLARLPALLQQYHPTLVILCIGGNDILRRRPYNVIALQLEKLIQLIKSSGASIILIGVPGLHYSVTAAGFYRSVAEQENIPVDMELLPRLFLNEQYKSDPIHLNNAGYQALAAGIKDFMQKIKLLPA